MAHRGNTGGPAYQNTLDAFKAAVAAHVGWLETDVRLTSDGVPVLSHDPAVPWACAGPARGRAVQTVTARQFTDTTCGPTHSRLTSLADLVNYVEPRTQRIFPEIKVAGTSDRVMTGLAGLHPDRYIVQSFLPGELAEVRRLGGQTCLLSSRADASAIGTAGTVGSCIGVPEVVAGVDFVREAHARGLRVLAWTADGWRPTGSPWTTGLDGLITDSPLLVDAPALPADGSPAPPSGAAPASPPAGPSARSTN